MKDKKWEITGRKNGQVKPPPTISRSEVLSPPPAMKDKQYYLQLKEEYAIPFPENATDEQVFEWAEKDKKQRTYLIDRYAETAWDVNSFANLLRNEEISESHFRELTRMAIDKCFKKLAI